MNLEPQKVLLLNYINTEIYDHISEVLQKLEVSFNVNNNFQDVIASLIQEKYEALIIIINEEHFKELDQFFIDIENEKETTLIFGIGPLENQKPADFDFYISDKEANDTVSLYPILQGIFGITQKVKNQAELSGMLIHDMRSPMQSILSYMELLQSEVFGALNEGQQKMIKNALRLQDQILDMLNELGDVMRFENKTFKLVKTTFKIRDLVQEVIQALWIQADKKNIKFSISVSDENHEIYGDRLALNRVFTNILSNAIRFSPENGMVRISCICTKATDDRASCQIKITDSGAGINEKDAALIFDKFFRIRRLKSAKGFGLGLYVSRLFVEAHGGTIGVYNNREGGATFHFQLPILNAEN